MCQAELSQAQAKLGLSSQQARLVSLATNKLPISVALTFCYYMVNISSQISFHGWLGFGGVLDQMKIRITQPQVDLEEVGSQPQYTAMFVSLSVS